MNLNWMCIPVLILSLLLFGAGPLIYQRCSGRRARFWMLGGAFAGALPGITFSLYNTHLFDMAIYNKYVSAKAVWFDAFCALPGSELCAVGAGLFAGVLTSALATAIPRWRLIFRAAILALLCLGLAVPYYKPLIAPLPQRLFKDLWRDGVCLQSTSVSCGPASAATILKKFGISESEKRLSWECHTWRGGTESWYLARALRRRGLSVKYMIGDGVIQDPPCPALACVRGHFIAILEKTADGYIIGDPIPTVGKREIRKENLKTSYQWTGFFLAIKSPKRE